MMDTVPVRNFSASSESPKDVLFDELCGELLLTKIKPAPDAPCAPVLKTK